MNGARMQALEDGRTQSAQQAPATTESAEIPECREVSREALPAYDHEDTGYRATCACGRSVVSIFPWLIEGWLADHDRFPA